MKRLPAFARAPWYLDPRESCCPLDATLEAVAIEPPAARSRRSTALTLRLLAADSATEIVFRYAGVVHHALTCYTCDQGMGVWLRDEFTASTQTLTHRITWRSSAGGTTQWLIEAQRVTFACSASAARRPRRR